MPVKPQEKFAEMLDAIDAMEANMDREPVGIKSMPITLARRVIDAKAAWGASEVEFAKAQEAAQNPFRVIEGETFDSGEDELAGN